MRWIFIAIFFLFQEVGFVWLEENNDDDEEECDIILDDALCSLGK